MTKADGGEKAKPKAIFFFVDGQKYETDQEVLTGLQIKAKVANWDPSFDLSLEGHGHDPDQLIQDDQPVRMDQGHGPLHFSSVPKANFG
jgi:hypothetical protein